MRTRELTVKEYAAHERVAERTVRRWIADGAVPVRRTPGGGIRIASESSVSTPIAVAEPPIATATT